MTSPQPCPTKSPTNSAQNKEFIEGSKEDLPYGTDEATTTLHKKRIKCLEAHQNMLGALYHVTPVISRTSLDDAISSIVELANIAEYYGCEQVIRVAISNHLHLFHLEVEDRCGRRPVVMLELAMKVQSEWVFREAATNLLGRNSAAFEKAVPKLEELEILDLMIDKRSEFIRRLQECEFAMLKIQLPVAQQALNTNMALQYFRQRLVDRLNAGWGSGLGKGYAKLYRDIQEDASFVHPNTHWHPANSYVCTLFYGPHPEITSAIVSGLQTVSAEAVEILLPILDDKTRKRAKSQEKFWDLKCMEIEDDEIPWLKE
jgi:hypothetical protein